MDFVPAWLAKAAGRFSNAAVPRVGIASARKVDSGVTTSRSYPKCASLRRASDFARVFQGAKRSTDKFFTVLVRPNDVGVPRLGLAISKKAAGGTNVNRNRYRRIVRESFRVHQNELSALDVVVMAKTPVQSADTRQIQQSLKKHWRNIETLCE